MLPIAYRRRHAGINSGSENEASDSDAAPRPGRAVKNTTPISDSEDDEGADESALSEDEDIEDDDLMNFDSEVVAQKLASERPIFADDQDDLDQSDVGGLELELTTASEIDLTIGAGLEDEDEAEAPVWKGQGEVSEAEIHEGSRDVNAKWPEHEAHYVPARSGACIISVRGQPEPLRNVIKAAIRMVTGDLIFKNAYICDFLHDRFESDHKFCVVVGRLLAGRVSLFLSNIKKLTNAGVQGFYQLGTGDECEKCVGSLLLGTTYIFPRQPVSLFQWYMADNLSGAPNLSSIRGHHLDFTSGSLASGGSGRRALVHKHTKRFASIIKKGPRRGEELEVSTLVMSKLWRPFAATALITAQVLVLLRPFNP
ncbi:hypothetical protein CVT26_007799 [Gymnopilus dilepis]|uniref:Uncharacterized protein n=1 Tax=Gymnopilus dilepis TaxID=231916 RepID=A0A409X7X7_9AGAR|nr:hypothetical protein CVT26_007799 [Gymnopilus dilepis]